MRLILLWYIFDLKYTYDLSLRNGEKLLSAVAHVSGILKYKHNR